VCPFRILNNNKGFTLVESLIAIVLLSIGILGLSAMTIGTIQGLTFSDKQTIAMTLARDRLEQIKQAGYVNATSEPYNTPAGYEQFQRRVDVTNNTPQPNTRTIVVTVAWQDSAGSSRQVVLRTVITP
jgi:prepilin-type N-terminal cleavage/methylation domain-containing protein